MAGPTQLPAVASDPQFRQAWRALRGDGSVQFDLTPAAPPPHAPDWLRTLGRWIGEAFRPIGRAIDWITSLMPEAPYARILLWAVLIAGALALIALVVQRLRTGEWRLALWRRRGGAGIEAEDEWLPEAAPARAWLEEADALAARGEFAEAVHHLLRRSIDDIAWRRPQLVRPALTSRELAASDGIPRAARDLFSSIARLVERSLFGGRPVGEPDWLEARATYSDFILPAAWRP